MIQLLWGLALFLQIFFKELAVYPLLLPNYLLHFKFLTWSEMLLQRPHCNNTNKTLSGSSNGTSRAFELGSELQTSPIVVEDLEHPGHMLIEVCTLQFSLCKTSNQNLCRLNLTQLWLPLNIADAMWWTWALPRNRPSYKTVGVDSVERCDGNPLKQLVGTFCCWGIFLWRCLMWNIFEAYFSFLKIFPQHVQVPRGFHRMDVFWPLLHLLQRRKSSLSSKIWNSMEDQIIKIRPWKYVVQCIWITTSTYKFVYKLRDLFVICCLKTISF